MPRNLARHVGERKYVESHFSDVSWGIELIYYYFDAWMSYTCIIFTYSIKLSFVNHTFGIFGKPGTNITLIMKLKTQTRLPLKASTMPKRFLMLLKAAWKGIIRKLSPN